MDATASSLSDTLTELKRFNVFPEYPTTCLEADKLISMKATNALKNVNNSFSSPLNEHLKRKRVLPFPHGVSHVRRP